jgi:hypothetical protein
MWYTAPRRILLMLMTAREELHTLVDRLSDAAALAYVAPN